MPKVPVDAPEPAGPLKLSGNFAAAIDNKRLA
jgi:hypothetical protein